MQHGHPQMTIADLLGNPLPADLVAAQDMDGIRIAWRKWLGMRVKIIDEYNRIPTRTQSALLTVIWNTPSNGATCSTAANMRSVAMTRPLSGRSVRMIGTTSASAGGSS